METTNFLIDLENIEREISSIESKNSSHPLNTKNSLLAFVPKDKLDYNKYPEIYSLANLIVFKEEQLPKGHDFKDILEYCKTPENIKSAKAFGIDILKDANRK